MNTVTRGPWCFSGMSGSGTNDYEVQPFRVRERKEFAERGLPCTGGFKIQKGQLYGLLLRGKVSDCSDRAHELGLLYGYLQRYGRNSCEFVMSRAARKRGMTTTNWMYLQKQKEHAK